MVRDMDEAISFYTSVMGLQLKSRYGNEFAIVQAPGITIGLHPAEPSQAGKVSIGLQVDSLEETMAVLTHRKLQFEGDVVEDPPMRFTFFRDPNGVEFYLAQESRWR
jgi:catechol 2,3-dioxygenase-like lactoylglutathione lyase family enzyme